MNLNEEKKKRKSVNMIANYIEIFLRKKKTKSVNMCMNNIEIFRQKK